MGLLAGPLFGFGVILFFELDSFNPATSKMAGIAIWMAIWWITEATPLAVTALLPVVLFPVFGIMNGKTVSTIYFNHIILLFIGGFLVALAMEKWNLHRRIALKILMLTGNSPKSILAGFMIATAFLSMWISNTATTMMMAPIALAVVARFEKIAGAENIKKYSIGIFLGVAYSASIGGIATLVGTPPNLSFARILNILFENAPEISFASWFAFAFPVSIVFLVILWFFLSQIFKPTKNSLKLQKNTFREQYENLDKISREEVIVLIGFVSLAMLWLLRADIHIGDLTIPGWARLFQNPKYFNDGTVAIAVAIVLFLIPAKNGKTILDWETAAKIPWHIVLLFGGGFALASGFKESGLAEFLGQKLTGVGSLHPILIVAAICLFVTFLTELTSNTATAEMLLPILGALAIAIKINPLMLMIPATLSCSCAFMLPVATPPNAIIFGTNRLKIPEMARVGIWLNLIGVLIITTAIFVIGKVVFEIDLAQLPDWAK